MQHHQAVHLNLCFLISNYLFFNHSSLAIIQIEFAFLIFGDLFPDEEVSFD